MSELITEPRAERRPLELRVAYHDACHLRHAQGITAEPRDALAAIPGLVPARARRAGALLRQRRDLQHRPARRRPRELGDRKAAAVLATGAEALASANPGCLIQLTTALRRAGRPLPAYHPIQLVDASIRGLSPDDLVKEARR